MTQRFVPVSFWAAGLLITATATLPLLSGCGSGSGKSAVPRVASAADSRKRGSATFTILWPDASRVVPLAAKSIVITMTRQNPDNVVAVPSQTVTPFVDTDPKSPTYNKRIGKAVFTNLELGNYVATATAYPNPDGTGNAQAVGPQSTEAGYSATVPILIQSGTNAQTALTMFATVKTLSLSPNPIPAFAVGQTRQITATAYDANGTVVIVADGALQWSTTTPAVSVTSPGLTTTVTGASYGAGSVVATYVEPGTAVGAEGTGASASISVSTVPVGLDPMAPWAKFHGDAQNTGQAGSLVTGSATTGSIAASFTASNAIYFSSPSVAPDGTVYVGAWDSNFYALNAGTLTKKWSYPTGGIIESSPAIGANGVVYVGSYDGTVYAFSTTQPNPGNVQPLWTFSTPGVIHGSPTLGTDGTLYVGSANDPYGSTKADNTLYAIDSLSGQLKWKFTPSTTGGMASTPALSKDGSTVYIASRDGNVYALATKQSSGGAVTPLWTYSTGGDFFTSSPVVASVGGTPVIFIASASTGSVYAINASSGSNFWTAPFTAPGANFLATPAVATDTSGNATALYVGSADVSPAANSRMYRLNPATGAQVWAYPASGTIGPVASSAMIGKNNAIYFGAEDGYVYAVKPDGTNLFTPVLVGTAGDFVDSSPGVAVDGSLLIGSSSGKVSLIK